MGSLVLVCCVGTKRGGIPFESQQVLRERKARVCIFGGALCSSFYFHTSFSEFPLCLLHNDTGLGLGAHCWLVRCTYRSRLLALNTVVHFCHTFTLIFISLI